VNVPEELALNKRLGQSGAIDFDKRLVCPATVKMDRLRDELFSRTTLSLNQNRGNGWRHLADAPADLANFLVLADEIRQVGVGQK
jgi:hypothetical protein